jgi:DnaJ homolog subfamily C member 17
MDSKRLKMKTELEAREREAASHKSSGYSNKTPEELFKAELERIMKENSKLIEEENENLRQQIYRERHSAQVATSSFDSSAHRIKIKWKADKDDKLNGGYNSENLNKFFNKYGDIVALIVSSKKNGSAIVEFKAQDAAEMAVSYEKGDMKNPLKLSWIGDAPRSKKPGPTITESDYESLVLRQLRQAEERKKLIEQMKLQDEDD